MCRSPSKLDSSDGKDDISSLNGWYLLGSEDKVGVDRPTEQTTDMLSQGCCGEGRGVSRDERRKRKMSPRWLQNQLFDKMRLKLGKRAVNKSRALDLLLIKLLGKKKRNDPGENALKETER